jgi:hypothetical protein
VRVSYAGKNKKGLNLFHVDPLEIERVYGIYNKVDNTHL